jgi:hypothetical protein
MYAKKEVMNQVINTGLAGLPQKDVVLAKHLIAKAKVCCLDPLSLSPEPSYPKDLCCGAVGFGKQ